MLLNNYIMTLGLSQRRLTLLTEALLKRLVLSCWSAGFRIRACVSPNFIGMSCHRNRPEGVYYLRLSFFFPRVV